MSLMGLAAKNLSRNRLRTVLTVLGVAVAIVTFLLLRTVIWSWNVAADVAAPDRIVTRHKVTFIMTMPKPYIDTIRNTPGVKNATWANWWGGKEPNHPNEFFMTIAVDPETYLEVYPEMAVPAEDVQSWKEDRQGAIVGDLLAEKFGWKKGDTIKLESTIFEGDWQFHVSGIYKATRKTVDRQQFLFHWNYFNDRMPEGDAKDQLGWIVSKVEGNPPALAAAVDKVFDEKDVQTVSADEATFQRGFLAGFSKILAAINVCSLIILGIMMMILGNTVAMGVRERTSEYGVLRAIGFLPKHLVWLVLSEAAVLGIIGGALGLALAFPVVQFGIGRFVEENMSGFFPYFRISLGNAIAAFGLALALATLASGIPAFQASRLKVVDALRRVA